MTVHRRSLKMNPWRLKGEQKRIGKPRSHPWVPLNDLVCNVVNGAYGLFYGVLECSRKNLLFFFWVSNGSREAVCVYNSWGFAKELWLM